MVRGVCTFARWLFILGLQGTLDDVLGGAHMGGLG